jgi:alpha-amylase
MMEWALPTAARRRFHALTQEFCDRPDVMRFLRGGQWRGFFSKYGESNLLQKKMLRVSERVRSLGEGRLGRAKRAKLARAREHILRAQCNDAFWHGVFGGLYAPHLRTELWRELVRAETLADEVAFAQTSAMRIERCDFDADGVEEVVASSSRLWALVRPAAGGTLEALDFRPSAVTLINSLQRRPEAYHERLREAGSAHGHPGRVASIHDGVRAREQGLERFLQYDRWPRNSFRLLLFAPEKTFEDYAAIGLNENAALAGGDYAVRSLGARHLDVSCDTSLQGSGGNFHKVCCLKRFSFAHEGDGYTVSCAVELSAAGSQPLRALLGLEVVLNLLAPTEPDRYFEAHSRRHPLRWAAAVPANGLRVVDEWQNVAATIEAPAATQFWIAPIETVSESELGFERVYQGSQILALWPVEIATGSPWRGEAALRIAPAHSPSRREKS